MPTYVSLIHWTDQGIKNYKDSPDRAADFTKLAESSGGQVRELLWTVGEYNLVTVVDFLRLPPSRLKRARIVWYTCSKTNPKTPPLIISSFSTHRRITSCQVTPAPRWSS